MTPSDPLEACLHQARSNERAGRRAEAIAAYEHLLRHWPALPNSWYNLARLQRKAGLPEAALASYQQALNQGISDAEEVRLNRGVIYADDLRQSDAAEHELNAALRLNPSYLPALLNLGNLHEDRGRRDAARSAYDQVLALDPCHAEALARQANLLVKAGTDEPMIGRLQQALLRAGAQPAERASLGFALGRLLDAAGEFDAAFSAYRQANMDSRASVPPGSAHYDRRAHEQFINRLISTFKQPPRQTAISPGPSAAATQPLFICGMFRSGSTLTEQVLAAHPRVVAGGEISVLPELVRTQLTPYPESLGRFSPQRLAQLTPAYREHLTHLAAAKELAAFVTDKRPENYLHIGLIKTLFPAAKIIHTTRSPLDNALSIYFLHLDPSMAYALDLGDIGHHQREYQRLMAHWRALYGSDILDFDYDAFVAEPRTAVQRLLDFCGLEWDESCMHFERVDNAVRTASVWQVRQPLYTSSSGRWRHYEAHLQALREMLQGRPPAS